VTRVVLTLAASGTIDAISVVIGAVTLTGNPVDITVTGQLDPRRWGATVAVRAKSGTLTPRNKDGALTDRAKTGTLTPRRWEGTT